MTDFDASTDLPAEIDTVEKLAAWAITILQELNPTEKVYEVVGKAPELVATAGIFDIDMPDENWVFTKTYRFIGRVSLPSTIEFKKGTKSWLTITAMSSTPIPADYKT